MRIQCKKADQLKNKKRMQTYRAIAKKTKYKIHYIAYAFTECIDHIFQAIFKLIVLCIFIFANENTVEKPK